MISAEIVLGDGDAALELVVGLQTLIAEDVAMAERTALVDAYGDPIVMQ